MAPLKSRWTCSVFISSFFYYIYRIAMLEEKKREKKHRSSKKCLLFNPIAREVQYLQSPKP